MKILFEYDSIPVFKSANAIYSSPYLNKHLYLMPLIHLNLQYNFYN